MNDEKKVRNEGEKVSKIENPLLYYYQSIQVQFDRMKLSEWTMQERMFIDYFKKAIIEREIPLARCNHVARVIQRSTQQKKHTRKKEIIEYVRADHQMMLRVINSAYTSVGGLMNSSLELALMRLGAANVRQLLVNIQPNRVLDQHPKYDELIEESWKMGFIIAHLAEKLAPNFKIYKDFSYFAAMFSTYGKAILVNMIVDFHNKVEVKAGIGMEFINKVGELVSHYLSALVLALWKIDIRIINTVENLNVSQPVARDNLLNNIQLARHCYHYHTMKTNYTYHQLQAVLNECGNPIPEVTLLRNLEDDYEEIRSCLNRFYPDGEKKTGSE